MFKQIISVVLSILIGYTSAQCQELAKSTHQVKLIKGTALKLEMLAPLDSATAKVGDDVPLQLMRSVITQEVAVIPAGEIFHGRVTEVRARTKSKSGLVKWKLDKIAFADSSTAPTEIFMISLLHDDTVPEHFSRLPWIRRWCTDGDFNCKDTILISALLLPFTPLFLFRWLSRHEKVNTIEYHLPAHSTVGLALKKDHKVRY